MTALTLERHAEFVARYDGRDIHPQPSRLVCVPCGHAVPDCQCAAPETRHPLWKQVVR